jgi:hypothetical protein
MRLVFKFHLLKVVSIYFNHKDVRDKGTSERGLRNFQQKIRSGKGLKNKSKITRILFEEYLNTRNV